MGTGDLCREPLAAVHHGRARQSSGTGLCGYCRRVLWVPGPRGKYSGKIRDLSRNPGYKSRGVAMLLNVVLTPGLPTPVKFQVRDLVRVVGIVAPFAQR